MMSHPPTLQDQSRFPLALFHMVTFRFISFPCFMSNLLPLYVSLLFLAQVVCDLRFRTPSLIRQSMSTSQQGSNVSNLSDGFWDPNACPLHTPYGTLAEGIGHLLPPFPRLSRCMQNNTSYVLYDGLNLSMLYSRNVYVGHQRTKNVQNVVVGKVCFVQYRCKQHILCDVEDVFFKSQMYAWRYGSDRDKRGCLLTWARRIMF